MIYTCIPSIKTQHLHPSRTDPKEQSGLREHYVDKTQGYLTFRLLVNGEIFIKHLALSETELHACIIYFIYEVVLYVKLFAILYIKTNSAWNSKYIDV